MRSPDFNKLPLSAAGAAVLVALLLLACRATPEKSAAVEPPLTTAPTPVVDAPIPPPTPAPAEIPHTPFDPAGSPHLRRVSWADLPGWREDDPAAAWQALLTSCDVLKKQDAWRPACAAASAMTRPGREEARLYFEARFQPYQLLKADGGTEGLATGYYEPLLRGSRSPDTRYRYPLYAAPDDLLRVDLPAAGTTSADPGMRARVEARRVVPYYDRAQIESAATPLRGREIAWVDDPVELFFLQIQGSGRLQLENGGVMRVGFADHNGRPYRSIGRLLIERGELTADRASMQGIKAWAQRNPDKLREVLNHNPRYVFFRELPQGIEGPLGALGVPLTPRRSIAADPRYVPLGAPVFLATTWPLSNKPLQQLMMAQDTGSAIRGAVRADFFWGYGDAAGREAGRMKQTLRMWVLLPVEYAPPEARR